MSQALPKQQISREEIGAAYAQGEEAVRSVSVSTAGENRLPGSTGRVGARISEKRIVETAANHRQVMGLANVPEVFAKKVKLKAEDNQIILAARWHGVRALMKRSSIKWRNVRRVEYR